MTGAAAARISERFGAVDDELAGHIDWAVLNELGWDAASAVFTPPAGHPSVGCVICAVVGCDAVARTGLRLCARCQRAWLAQPDDVTLETFRATGDGPRRKQPAGRLCRVCCTPGHQRPVRVRGLCGANWSVAVERGQTVEAYIDGDGHFPPATPRPSFGDCAVPACDRLAHRADPVLCEIHDRAWRKSHNPTGTAFVGWCGRQRSADNSYRHIVLRGLPPLARVQILYGLQCCVEVERRMPPRAVQPVVDALRAAMAGDLFDLPADSLPHMPRRFLVFTRDRLTLATASPVAETAKDDWDLRVLGFARGRLHFGQLSQRWLRDTAKRWAAQRLPTLDTSSTALRCLRCLSHLSASLRAHRSDRGELPGRLGRADISAFANDLAHLEAAGQISRRLRRVTIRHVSQFLREARA